MDKKEILNFCIEKKILLDNDILEMFSQVEDLDSIKLLIEKFKILTHKSVITRNLLFSDKDALEKIFLDPLVKNKEVLKELTIKLGLNLEISAKTAHLNGFSYLEESRVKILNSFNLPGKKFEVKDFTKHFRNRFEELKNIIQINHKLDSLISINKINGSKQNLSIIGMIYNKIVTKNKNIIFEIEDLTGRIKILFNKGKEELYKQAENLPIDSVLAFKCSGNKEILFVNEIIYPGASLGFRKKSNVEEYALFVGDLHYGSKNFMQKEFLNFIDYLNGNIPNTPEANSIKYLFIVGDLVTGIGNYPNQERDLIISDLEEQFKCLTEILSKIRKDIKIIICPGNHDGVRLMEPQPVFDEKYAWPLYDLENVILVENPGCVNIAQGGDFSGFDILLYHGFSYPYYAKNIPKLISEKSMNSPEKIMEYLLNYRHLAPTHGSVQYYPYEKDMHIIKKIPDIFFSGHYHKSGIFHHNNILIISSSSWESLTPYQEKFENEPDYCKVPMVNLKTRAVKILDFEEKREENLEGSEKND